MILTFLSLQAIRIGGLALGYAAIIWLNRSAGQEALGQYFFLLNSVIVVGTLAALGLPTLVQRLSAQLDAAHIGAGTRLVLRRRWPWMLAVAATGTTALLALDADQPLTPTGAVTLGVAAAGFALTLMLIETLRIARGPRVAELQRNLVRPALILALLSLGLGARWAVPAAVLAAAALALWLNRRTLYQDPGDDAELSAYVDERGRDLHTVFVLGALGLVFGAMDVVLFGLLEDNAETGVYGAGSRYGMIVNVALLAGNAQMVQHLAKVAARADASGDSLAQMRRQVWLVRVGSTTLLAALACMLPLYARIVDMPVAQLWPYAAVATLSFWLQGLWGPVNIFLMQAHEADRLIRYHLWGLGVFSLVVGTLSLHGTTLSVPLGAAAGANTVKLLSWLRIRSSRGIWV